MLNRAEENDEYFLNNVHELGLLTQLEVVQSNRALLDALQAMSTSNLKASRMCRSLLMRVQIQEGSYVCDPRPRDVPELIKSIILFIRFLTLILIIIRLIKHPVS